MSLPATAQEKDSWDRYEPRSIQSVIEQHQDLVKELDTHEKPMLLTGDWFPSTTKLTYRGKSRPIEGKRKVLLGYWKKSYAKHLPSDILEVFGTEMLFSEGKQELWIAVQKPLVESIEKDVHQDEEITGYVIWVGAIKDGKKWEWLFAMNGFDTKEDKESN